MDNNIFLVAGLGWGDEGKGTIVDYLVREYAVGIVVRFNGGPQAQHNVVTPEGMHHGFSQFSSGTFVPRVKTYLSRYMLVDPWMLMIERGMLKKKNVHDAVSRLFMHPECLMVTPYHRLVCCAKELARGGLRYGTTGLGVGEAVLGEKIDADYAPRMRDIFDIPKLRRKMAHLHAEKLDQAEQIVCEHPDNSALQKLFFGFKNNFFWSNLVDFLGAFTEKFGHSVKDNDYLSNMVRAENSLVFEGAQGVLLDPKYGLIPPYVTKTNTTFKNAHALIEEIGLEKNIVRIGVTRAYATKHGYGPFLTEDHNLLARLIEFHNVYNEWQGLMRVGWLDLVALKYALSVLGRIDHVALTNVDRLMSFEEIKVCVDYDAGLPVYTSLTHEEYENEYIPFLQFGLESPISIISTGPTADDKIKIKELTEGRKT